MLIKALTDREKEVGACLVKGMSAKEASKQLGISIFTVEDHRKSIKKKLNGKSAYEIGFMLASHTA